MYDNEVCIYLSLCASTSSCCCCPFGPANKPTIRPYFISPFTTRHSHVRHSVVCALVDGNSNTNIIIQYTTNEHYKYSIATLSLLGIPTIHPSIPQPTNPPLTAFFNYTYLTFQCAFSSLEDELPLLLLLLPCPLCVIIFIPRVSLSTRSTVPIRLSLRRVVVGLHIHHHHFLTQSKVTRRSLLGTILPCLISLALNVISIHAFVIPRFRDMFVLLIPRRRCDCYLNSHFFFFRC